MAAVSLASPAWISTAVRAVAGRPTRRSDLPAATRFAVEAYVHFVRDKSPLEAIASSLTELFAPNLHEERISGMLAHYDFVNPDIMSYFSRRLTQAPRDANFALDYVKRHAQTPAERAAYRARIIAEHREQQQPSGDSGDPRSVTDGTNSR